MTSSLKIYFAGPDVFSPDVAAWAVNVRQLCHQAGHIPLLPVDNVAETATEICRGNLEFLRAADVVVANLNPFRGCEPDSGTVFEIGFAVALGKPVVAYLDDMRSLLEKLKASNNVLECVDGRCYDCNGQLIEDFGLPLNLMLATTMRLVTGGIPEALAALECR